MVENEYCITHCFVSLKLWALNGNILATSVHNNSWCSAPNKAENGEWSKGGSYTSVEHSPYSFPFTKFYKLVSKDGGTASSINIFVFLWKKVEEPLICNTHTKVSVSYTFLFVLVWSYYFIFIHFFIWSLTTRRKIVWCDPKETRWDKVPSCFLKCTSIVFI